MPRDAKIKIGATTKVQGPINKVIGRLKKLGAVTKKVNAGIKASIRGIGGVFRMTQKLGIVAIATLGGIGLAIKKAFDFELAEKQFEVLLGSVEKAKQRFKELKELSAGTPFELKNLIEASKMLEGFGIKAKENAKALTLVGDAAAALNPEKLEEMALAYGRLFASSQTGKGAGEPTMRLLELMVLAPKTKMEIDALAQSVGNSGKIMALAQRDLMRFKGGMEKLSTVGHGLFSTLKDNWTISLAAFGDEFMDLSKNTMREFIQKLKDLRNDGSIKAWAESAVKSLSTVKSLLADIFGGDPVLRAKAFSDIGNLIKFAFIDAATAAGRVLVGIAPIIGDMIGEAAKNAIFGGKDKRAAMAQAEKEIGFSTQSGGRFDVGSAKRDAAVRARAAQLLPEIRAKRLSDMGMKAKSEIGEGSRAAEFAKKIAKERLGVGEGKPDAPFSGKRRTEDDRTRFIRLADERKAAKAKAQMDKFSLDRLQKSMLKFAFGKKEDKRKFVPEMLGRGVRRRAESPLDGEVEGANVGGLTRRQFKRKRGQTLLNAGIRLEKDEAGVAKGIEERRGIGLGELFDMKQFGFTGKDDKLGTKNNPMVVAVSEELV